MSDVDSSDDLPSSLSICLRLKRIVYEYGFVQVPFTQDVFKEDENGESKIDTE